MKEKETLAYQLRAYTRSICLPMHMPGHKRKMPAKIKELLNDLVDLDVTELEDTDDLHHPRGILRDALAYASKVYGTQKSYFLVNGSTCGVHTAIRTAVGRGEELIIAGNAHFSAHQAIELNGIQPVWVEVKKHKKYGMYMGVEATAVEEALQKHPRAKAVYITSPTYEGIVSDVRSIANLCHRRNVILIVDEAHGAHLPFMQKKSTALSLGADFVIQSLHKSLPCFTQTALLHLCSERADVQKTERNLRIFESSSPSYILLAAMDACIRYCKEEEGEFLAYRSHLRTYREGKYELFAIFSLSEEEKREYGVYALDESKIVITIPDGALDGAFLAEILRRDYGVETEMSAEHYVLALSSVCDGEEQFAHLEKSLRDIESRWRTEDFPAEKKVLHQEEQKGKKEKLKQYIGKPYPEYIYVYPPGIPLLRPGEVLRQEVFEELCVYVEKGYKTIL